MRIGKFEIRLIFRKNLMNFQEFSSFSMVICISNIFLTIEQNAEQCTRFPIHSICIIKFRSNVFPQYVYACTCLQVSIYMYIHTRVYPDIYISLSNFRNVTQMQDLSSASWRCISSEIYC